MIQDFNKVNIIAISDVNQNHNYLIALKCFEWEGNEGIVTLLKLQMEFQNMAALEVTVKKISYKIAWVSSIAPAK